MPLHLALRPALHGAVGPCDEILTLLPVVIGVALLAYLYFSARRAPPPSDEADDAEIETPGAEPGGGAPRPDD